MLRCEMDHLVVTAGTLDSGINYVQRQLGVILQTGGQHVRMGTHNALLRLGKKLYLEVIAVDPTIPAPQRPRWFQLDDLNDNGKPRLTTWVIRTTDIRNAVSAMSVSPGPIEPMSRGELSWRISIPADGKLLFDGLLPSVIEWGTAQHPAERLTDVSVTLVRLEGRHPQSQSVNEQLQAIGWHDESFAVCFEPVTPEQPLTAIFRTPHGIRSL